MPNLRRWLEVDPGGFIFGPEGRRPWIVRVTRRIVRPGKDGPEPTGKRYTSVYRDGKLIDQHINLSIHERIHFPF